MAQVRRRRRDKYHPREVQEAARELWDRQYSPSRIEAELKRLPHLRGLPLPRERTLQDWAREWRIADDSGPWSAVDPDFDGDEVRTVLATMAGVIEHTDGRVTGVTRDEARHITRIASVVGTAHGPMNAWATYRLARFYLRAEKTEASTASLDAFLAYEPWSGDRAFDKYLDAVQRGRVSPPPWVPERDYFTERLVSGVRDLSDSDKSELKARLTARTYIWSGLTGEEPDDTEAQNG